jgi:hypothetical protein
MKKLEQKLNTGFMTIELLIAFAILLINITGVVLLLNQNQNLALSNETNNEATAFAKAQIEKIKSEAVNSLGSVVSSGPTNDGIYTKEIIVEDLDASYDDPDTEIDETLFMKKVTSLISWAGINDPFIKLETLITNPEATYGGDTCSAVLTGDWTNPQKIEYEFGNQILNDTSSGFPITSIQVFNKKMYVTVNNINGNNDETFFILDVSDSTLTSSDVLGKLDNSPGAISEGLNAVAIDGINYAYVANAYDSSPQACIEGHNCAQLQVIDISPPSNPIVVKNLKINSFTTGNKLANATTVAYKNGIVFLGLANATSGAEIYIFDVGGGGQGGSPINPVSLSHIENGSGVNSIVVKGDYMYVASPNSQELKIYNIDDLLNPSPAGSFNSPSGAGNGKSINIVGNKLYLGVTVPNSGNDFHILNNNNPNTTLPVLGGMNSVSSINGIIVRDYLSFLITGDGEFQTWKTDDPSSITQYASPLTLPPGSGGGLSGTASDCEGNNIFIGSKSSNDKGYISIIYPGVPSEYALTNNGNITVSQGSSGNNTITRTVVSGNPSTINLNTPSGLPVGATATFTNNPCDPSPSCSSQLTISTTLATPAGTYPVTVTGNGGITTSFDLIVNTFTPFDYTLSSGGNITMGKNQTITGTINRTLVSGTSTAITLTASGFPASPPNNTTITFASNPCSPTCSSVMTIKTKNNTPTGTYLITVTGSPNGTGPRTTTFNLTVTP